VAAVALITGGTGLIGQHVLQSWDVVDVRPEPVDHRAVDLLRPGAARALVDRVRPAVVLHLAWTASGTRGYRADPDNGRWVDASLELAAACADVGTWFLATGTPLDTAVEPGDAYSAAKGQLRRALQGAIDSGACTWLRPFYVVDPQRRRPELVDQTVAAREAEQTVVLRTPASRHDFIHARDVGTAVVETVRHGLRGEVPIGSGRLRQVGELVTALGVSWSPDPAHVDKVPPQHHQAAEIGRLLALGWSPIRTTELFTRG
jgi:nucleoside-diphosphate-sugar epimerase